MRKSELTPEQRTNDRKASSFHAHMQGWDNPDKSGRPQPCNRPFLSVTQEMASSIDAKTGKTKKPCQTCNAAQVFFNSLNPFELSRVLR